MIEYLYYVIIILSLWAVLPLLFMLLISMLAYFFKKNDFIIRRIMKIGLGLGKENDDGIQMQVKHFDCGKAVLSQILMDFELFHADLSLPEPSSMKDIVEVASKHGCLAYGYSEATLTLIEESIKRNGKVMTLLKIYYPFEGWWVKPTKLMLKVLCGKEDLYHWVMIEKIHEEYIYIIDPYFGKIKLSRYSFEDCWTKKVIFIYNPLTRSKTIAKRGEDNICIP